MSRPGTITSYRLMGVAMIGFVIVLIFLYPRGPVLYILSGVGSVGALGYLLWPGYFVRAEQRKLARRLSQTTGKAFDGPSEPPPKNEGP